MHGAEVELSEVLAWGLIAAGGVYAVCFTRLGRGGAAAAAALAAIATKAMLLPLI